MSSMFKLGEVFAMLGRPGFAYNVEHGFSYAKFVCITDGVLCLDVSRVMGVFFDRKELLHVPSDTWCTLSEYGIQKVEGIGDDPKMKALIHRIRELSGSFFNADLFTLTDDQVPEIPAIHRCNFSPTDAIDYGTVSGSTSRRRVQP